jgi:peptide/nickel transport system ATP-binding protein
VLERGPAAGAAAAPPLLAVESLAKRFPVRGGLFRRAKAYVHAVDGVSFVLHPGETLGIVGGPGAASRRLRA